MAKRYKYKVRSKPKYSTQELPPLPFETTRRPTRKIIRVFVEGYEDVSFWRGIFDDYETDKIGFEISVPLREDFAKGKKVLLSIAQQGDDSILLCMDSDFDYLFADQTPQAKLINSSPRIFHTYAYATENYLCYAPSLHNVCVKATKNDIDIFDFERFMADYSRIIYPLFVWYAYSAQTFTPATFTLLEFRSTVKLNYLEVDDNGLSTLAWLNRQVQKQLSILRNRHPEITPRLPQFEQLLAQGGVTPLNTYLFMQGHTLLDNVVMVVLTAVCERLKSITSSFIESSERRGVFLNNEMSNFNNAQHNVRDALMFNENYKECFLYRKLKDDIETYLSQLER